MTDTTKAVVPVWQTKARLALREGASLGEIAKTMIAVEEETAEVAPAEETKVARPFPPIPEAVALDDDQKAALRALSIAFNAVRPTTRRKLKTQEVTDLFHERVILRSVLEPLKNRDEQIKEYVRTHLDLVAEEMGAADPVETPRDEAGHYIVASPGKPERLNVPGTAKAFSREYRSGNVTISGGDLLDLYESGEITREVYLSFTVERRVFDEAKATAAIVKDPTLLDVLRKITHRAGDGTSLFERKAK